jgi:hypothetical protein
LTVQSTFRIHYHLLLYINCVPIPRNPPVNVEMESNIREKEWGKGNSVNNPPMRIIRAERGFCEMKGINRDQMLFGICLLTVEFYEELCHCCLPFGVGIVLVDAFFVGLFDGDQ